MTKPPTPIVLVVEDGKVELDYRPGGFVYTLDVPIEALITKPASASAAAV